MVYRPGKRAAVPDAHSRIPKHAQPQHALVTAMASQAPLAGGPRMATVLCNKHAAVAQRDKNLVYRVLHSTHCNRIYVDKGEHSTFNHFYIYSAYAGSPCQTDIICSMTIGSLKQE